jgi:hypothetical protein
MGGMPLVIIRDAVANVDARLANVRALIVTVHAWPATWF